VKSKPAVESASDTLVVLEGADPVIDIFMPDISEAMLKGSFGAREAIVTEILTLLAVKVSNVQNNGDMAKRRGRVKKCE
jgi:hypothetical protein